MENKCEHPDRAREYYGPNVYKCYDCGTIFSRHYPLTEEELKLIDEIDKFHKTGPYSPFFKKYRTEILSWLITIGGVSGVSAFIYAMSVYSILLLTVTTVLGIIGVVALLYCFKMLVKMFVFDEYE